MNERIFTDKTGQELIVQSRKSAIFFRGIADIAKPNKYGKKHEEYICISELKKVYQFEGEQFKELKAYLQSIGEASWGNFQPKEITKYSDDYDDYYDPVHDNNGTLYIAKNQLGMEGAYTQLKSAGERILFIKFKKPTFETFMYDLERLG